MPARRSGPRRLLGTIGLWGGLWSALLLQFPLPGSCAEPARPNLQGSWELNDDLTARLSKDHQAPAGDSWGGSGDHPHAGLGGMGPTGGQQNDPAVGDWSPAKERHEADMRREVVAALDSLTIVQRPGQVTITDRDGHARMLKTDGSKLRDQGPAGAAQLRASWTRDGSLEIEVKPDKGTRRTEAYVISNDGKHLYLTVTIPGQLNQVVRAYDRVPAPAAPAGSPAPTQEPKPAAEATSAPPPVNGPVLHDAAAEEALTSG